MDLLPPWAFASDVWDHFTSRSTLWRHLQDYGHAWKVAPDGAWLGGEDPAPDTLPSVVSWWKTSHVDRLEGREKEGALRRWIVLAEMLWCFDEARKSESLEASEIDRIQLGARLPVFDERGIHPFAGDPASRSVGVARAYTCIRSFRGVEPLKRVDIPIALYDTPAGRGFLATLALELMPGGVGEVADHPAARFDTILHDPFVDSMGRAWKMALETMTGTTRVDGRWHVRRGPPFVSSTSSELALDQVDGPSASGAAARGWWHALRNQTPDAEVVVLAQVSSDAQSLEDVNFITAKVEAIVREGIGADDRPAFDTVVVIGDRSKVDAEKARGSNGELRVVPLI